MNLKIISLFSCVFVALLVYWTRTHHCVTPTPLVAESDLQQNQTDSNHRYSTQIRSQHLPLRTEHFNSKKEFKAFTQEVMHAFPTITDLHHYKHDQVYFTPEIIIHAGIQLGQVEESLNLNPDLISEGIYFFKDCAQKHHLPIQIRALCFAKLTKFTEFNDHQQLHLDVSDEVKELASQI